MPPTLAAHLRIARFDHWVKNVFVLPGLLIAWTLDPAALHRLAPLTLLAGFLAVGLTASSNYVLNEILDAPFDRLHPLKKDRPVAAGLVILPLAWLQWLLLFAAAVPLALLVSRPFTYTMAALWLMGWVYNIPPVRAKDHAFLDVLTEAINNPLRFLAGWYISGTHALPIASVLVSYWMAGCYFMAIKRFAECRDLRSASSRVAYRPCYRTYTEQNLLISILFYGSLSMLFFGAFIGRYRLELALAFPFVALVMAVYFAMAYKPDSAAQRPEGLIREPLLMGAVSLCALVLVTLLFVDLPVLHHMFPTSTP